MPVKCTKVDMSVIRAHFSSDAWQAVLHLVDVVKPNSVWLCFACKCALDTSEIIGY